MLFFVADTSFIIRQKSMTLTEHFPCPRNMFSMDTFLNHTKNDQIVKSEKGFYARSRNWSTLKLSF